MRGRHLRTWIALAAVAALGCSGGGMRRRVAMSEPPLALPGESADGTIEEGAVVVTPPAAGGVAFVDRHPLFSKPREYYENSGNNKVVKTVAATVVGVPAGIVGEVRQIFAGRPASPPR